MEVLDSQKIIIPHQQMEILDTNIIIRVQNGHLNLDIKGKHISSVTANEFLEVYDESAPYYVPSRASSFLVVARPFRKTSTDRVIFYLKNAIPTR